MLKNKINLWWSSIKGDGYDPHSMHPLFRMIVRFLRIVRYIIGFFIILFITFKSVIYSLIYTIGLEATQLRIMPLGVMSVFIAAFIFSTILKTYFEFDHQHELWKKYKDRS